MQVSVNEDRYVPVIWCCVTGQWRACDDIPERGIGTLNEAAQAAEDDVCHWGDAGVVVRVAGGVIARVVGPDIDRVAAYRKACEVAA